MQILFGTAICEGSANGYPSREFVALSRSLRSWIDDGAQPGLVEALAQDLRLSLICNRLLSQTCGTPSRLQSFASDVAEVLREERNPSSHVAERILLGHVADLSHDALDDVRALEDREYSILAMSEDQLRDLCTRLAEATHYGSRPAQLGVATRRRLGHAISLVLLQALRAHDLAFAALLMRAWTYLRLKRGAELVLAIRTLQDQQRRDGAFGYYGMEEPYLSERHLPHSELDIDLPITVSAIWALAETERRPWNVIQWIASNGGSSALGRGSRGGPGATTLLRGTA
jgi:hypothetical protein